MAMHVTIRVCLRWKEKAPDGKKCVLCGDLVLLLSWELQVVILGEVVDRYTVCDSCKDVLDIG